MTLTLKIFFPFYYFTLTNISLVIFLGNTTTMVSVSNMNFGLLLIILGSCRALTLHSICCLLLREVICRKLVPFYES